MNACWVEGTYKNCDGDEWVIIELRDNSSHFRLDVKRSELLKAVKEGHKRMNA